MAGLITARPPIFQKAVRAGFPSAEILLYVFPTCKDFLVILLACFRPLAVTYFLPSRFVVHPIF